MSLLVESLMENIGTVKTYVNNLFGHEPPSPRIIIGGTNSLRMNVEFFRPGQTDGYLEGFYLPSYGVIGVDPVGVGDVAKYLRRRRIRLNPNNEMVRTFAKEYSQHVYSDLHNYADIDYAEDSYRGLLETLLSLTKDRIGDLVRSGLVLCRTEAYGLVGMYSAAKFLSHTDDYENDFLDRCAMFPILISALSFPKADKTEIVNKLLYSTSMGMSNVIALQKLRLRPEEFREDVRRPPNAVYDNEVSHVLDIIDGIKLIMNGKKRKNRSK